MAIKILIDSASDITEEEAKKMGVYMIPMVISFKDEDYYDGVNLLPDLFYQKLMSCDVLPKTAQINPYRYEEEFERLTKNGDEVICITLSSKLSGTYNNAKTAAENYKDKVFVVDSLNACIGERLLCEYALELIKKGLNVKDIVKILDEVKAKIVLIAMIDTLEYLRKGGRISSVMAIAGDMFAIKPLISVVDGEVKMIGKAIGSKKGNVFINSYIEKNGGINFDMPHGLIWSGLDDIKLQRYMKQSFDLFENKDIRVVRLGSTIGVHIGPGGIGVAFFKNDL